MRRRFVALVILVAAGSLPSGVAQANTFDQLGPRAAPSDVAVAPGGGILVAGDGVRGRNVVISYTADGNLDGSFGSMGIWRSDLERQASPSHIAIQGDKILVLEEGRLSRLEADGKPDRTFGSNGSVGVRAFSAIEVLTDGRIVLAGSDTRCLKLYGCRLGDSVVARYDADGKPDPSFGTGGETAIDLNSAGTAGLFSLAIDGAGRVYAAGGKNLLRLDQSGVLDPAFGGDGLVPIPFARSDFEVVPISLSDGSVTIAGADPEDPSPLVLRRTVVARFGTDGLPDTGFGAAGSITLPRTPRTAVFTVGTDGLYLAGPVGCTGVGCSNGAGLARLLADGTPDPAWGSGGLVNHPIGPQWGTISTSAARQPDGRIVFAASLPLGETNSITRISLLRLEPNGAFDRSFGSEGQVLTPSVVPRCRGGRNFLYLAPGQNYRTVGNAPARVIGSDVRDSIRGAAGRDVICGRESGDRISGHRGHDRLLGQAGPDRIDGGPQRDLLYGGTGNDRIRARDGFRDLVRCGRGRDVAIVDQRDRVWSCEEVKRRPVAIID